MRSSILLLFTLIACSGRNSSEVHTTPAALVSSSDSLPLDSLLSRVICISDTSESYALFLPSDTANASIIYFFDPHADGSLPLSKYRRLAEAYHYILIGSNNSKNGNDPQTSEHIWKVLYNDTQKQLHFSHSSVYVCGFSGGAKVGAMLASYHPEIQAVIANGAAPMDKLLRPGLLSYTGITGKGDMNMTELMAFDSTFDKQSITHRLLFFNGKHEWAPAETMSIAFSGLQLDAMRKKTLALNDSLTGATIYNCKNRIDSCVRYNDFLQAVNECSTAVNLLHGIADISFFETKKKSLLANAAYAKQLKEQQRLFATEQNKKAEYNRHFGELDMHYWNNTIEDLKAKSGINNKETAMYQRLLVYLSLAFYSISNQLINQHQDEAAGYFVQLYKKADSENSEAWYFSAILQARKNNKQAAEDDLLKAVQYGFNDVSRLINQPELSQLNLQKIAAAIKQ